MFDEAEYNIILLYNPNGDPKKQPEIAHLYTHPACVHKKVKFYAYQVVEAKSSSGSSITLRPQNFEVDFDGESNFKDYNKHFDQDHADDKIVRSGEYPFKCKITDSKDPKRTTSQWKGGNTHPPGPAGAGA